MAAASTDGAESSSSRAAPSLLRLWLRMLLAGPQESLVVLDDARRSGVPALQMDRETGAIHTRARMRGSQPTSQISRAMWTV